MSRGPDLPPTGGGTIPQLGLGVWQTPRGAATERAVAAALAAGYRHIDTARIYGNEADVGVAVRASGIPRREELLAEAEIVPSVDQIEVSPFLQQRETRAACARHRIVVEAYSPLTRGQRLADPTVAAVAARAGRTPAQVMLRWGVQHGLVVLPKAAREPRIRENAAIFDFTLDAAAMAALDGCEESLVTGWDPRRQP